MKSLNENLAIQGSSGIQKYPKDSKHSLKGFKKVFFLFPKLPFVGMLGGRIIISESQSHKKIKNSESLG